MSMNRSTTLVLLIAPGEETLPYLALVLTDHYRQVTAKLAEAQNTNLKLQVCLFHTCWQECAPFKSYSISNLIHRRKSSKYRQ